MALGVWQSSILLVVLYVLSGIFYRLYLSPISKIPGPKLAAATWWYEYYHDIINYGKYIFKINNLHEKYGPIVRISPHEIHINDPDFYDALYHSTNTNRKDRWIFYTQGLGLPASTLGTVEYALHRRRRAAMSPFFSKQNVRKLQPAVQERVDLLVNRFTEVAKSSGIVNLEQAFAAFTNDVVMQYCFGQSDHRIEAPNFDPTFYQTSFSAGISNGVMRHMNFLMAFMNSLPISLATKISPEMASFVKLRTVSDFNLACSHNSPYDNQIDALKEEIIHEKETGRKDGNIFHSLLESDLPASEKSTARLAEEAVLLVGAGTNTTSWTLTVIAYYLTAQPDTLQKLKDELESAIPDPSNPPPLADLEKLPYLTAVLKEGLRLGFGSTSRIPRIALDQPIKYHDIEIPIGVPVSMAIPDVHLNARVFPNPLGFHPERWTEDKDGHLEKYLIAFSRGPRMCIGLNLAWSEMYVCVSGLFRRFGSKDVRGKGDVGSLELFETERGDVEMSRDCLFPVTRDGSKGVRVKTSFYE
ncbi:cytochrome P450 [Tricladium varicosporioides]|nr:cytochrome P450 [Hymenoscyphus varicosporioides]